MMDYDAHSGYIIPRADPCVNPLIPVVVASGNCGYTFPMLTESDKRELARMALAAVFVFAFVGLVSAVKWVMGGW